MEPIKAFDHLQRMRQDEREAAEAAAAAKLREIEAEETGGANEKQPNPEAEPGLGEQTFTPAAHTALGESGQVTVGIDPTTYDTTDYDEYKFLQTADEVPSIRKSTQTDTIGDLEHYPMSPPPMWKSEDELEQLVSDAQEQLENLRENTDANGYLNSETIIRLLMQKLLSKPCQNQGFVLDGFPKSLEQAEMLFRPDPDDEESVGDEKHPGFHRLITPHHVINLVGSNKFTLHRLYQRLESMGMDPATAKVIPPPWPPGFRTDRPNTVGGPDLGDLPAESPPEEEAPHVTETKEMEDGINDPEGMQKLYGNLETHLERYERRLQVYRALMAPNAAAARNRLISEAIKMAEEERNAEEERQRLILEAAAEAEREKRKAEREAQNIQAAQQAEAQAAKEQEEQQPQKEQEQQQQQQGKEGKIPPPFSDDTGITDDDVLDQPEIVVPREILDGAYRKALDSRLATIPPLPQVPNETEENVLTFFDIREIHPIQINMDADFSNAPELGECRENCMEEIWKAIGRTTAVPLPFSQAAPQEVTDTEQFDEMGKQAERMRLRRIRSCEMRTKRQTAEEEKLRRKQQEDWNQWLSLIKTQEYQCVQAKALPMRHYLMKYVMPDLTQALLDCSEIRPEDPIDFIVSSLQVI
ncbi:Adenylate kinase 7 [Fasciolopsis buskii]|uniref:Adenylate kinase 7 n=1 Tax=Fasciolopsis buskii TaxID=27845 RepID=A0A8E0RQW8_9TREM|nr:Adenylate kinase 7 [Fasciolopsis buski]